MEAKKKINWRRYSLFLILIVMLVVCSIMSDSFFRSKNLSNILKQVSIVTILAFAQGMIIIAGQIDLSIGYLAGMAGTFACIVYVATGSLLLSVLLSALLLVWSTVCSYRDSAFRPSL